ncbi:hypothetical protein J1605_010743 [Eschrichtius robustus]|uniref:Basic proline-rich protein-like n=1 Tax=Eschrichtius robustus TaxID=9764 RepID=A0AB34GTK9_ESCRO|nr:hypothetical protein J1605_010743 [Eschrichtius robustus]
MTSNRISAKDRELQYYIFMHFKNRHMHFEKGGVENGAHCRLFSRRCSSPGNQPLSLGILCLPSAGPRPRDPFCLSRVTVSPAVPKAFGHLCTNLIRLRAENRESQPRIRLVPLPAREKQSGSGADALHPAAGARPTHTCPAVPSPGPPVPSARPAPSALPGLSLSPPPARGPRRPASGSAAAAGAAGPPQKGAHWPCAPSFTRRIPPPAGLRGNFLIIVTPKSEKPRAGSAEPSPSESRAAVQRPPRCAGRGGRPGPRKEGTAEPRPSVSRVLRGTAVRARLPEGRLRLRAPPVTARGRARGEVGARRLQCLRGAGARGPRARLAGVLGALPLTYRALAPGEAGSRSRDGGAPRPDSAACGLGGTATPKVKKRILPFLPARPYLNSGASATPLR